MIDSIVAGIATVIAVNLAIVLLSVAMAALARAGRTPQFVDSIESTVPRPGDACDVYGGCESPAEKESRTWGLIQADRELFAAAGSLSVL